MNSKAIDYSRAEILKLSYSDALALKGLLREKRSPEITHSDFTRVPRQGFFNQFPLFCSSSENSERVSQAKAKESMLSVVARRINRLSRIELDNMKSGKARIDKERNKLLYMKSQSIEENKELDLMKSQNFGVRQQENNKFKDNRKSSCLEGLSFQEEQMKLEEDRRKLDAFEASLKKREETLQCDEGLLKEEKETLQKERGDQSKEKKAKTKLEQEREKISDEKWEVEGLMWKLDRQKNDLKYERKIFEQNMKGVERMKKDCLEEKLKAEEEVKQAKKLKDEAERLRKDAAKDKRLATQERYEAERSKEIVEEENEKVLRKIQEAKNEAFQEGKKSVLDEYQKILKGEFNRGIAEGQGKLLSRDSFSQTSITQTIGEAYNRGINESQALLGSKNTQIINLEKQIKENIQKSNIIERNRITRIRELEKIISNHNINA
ncbi:unnamed protein product [Moneuplotes crassus]|uniref:Uncharacterized protein n=1 Tax=Euplotes crassus TaxID=5936 RepID=A0AAD1XE64_EUPCR|nr:unnamed protein product [Moneuplotes crassus]